MSKKPPKAKTWCFRCHAKRKIINGGWKVTKNDRNLYQGKCDECGGNIALMCGYNKLPDTVFVVNKKRRSNMDDDSEE